MSEQITKQTPFMINEAHKLEAEVAMQTNSNGGTHHFSIKIGKRYGQEPGIAWWGNDPVIVVEEVREFIEFLTNQIDEFEEKSYPYIG